MKNVNGMWLPDTDTFFQTRGDYESADYSLLKTYIAGGRTAVDIGAHVGYWSRRLVQDYAYVYAFEAMPSHAECLKLNVVADNFELHNIALSNQLGTVNFTANSINTGMCHVSETGEAVFCQRLDHWQLSDVDLVKIDVEGHELQVLQGAAETVQQCHPVLFMEILNTTPLSTRTAILDLLHSWNYVMVDNIDENYIFVWQDDAA